MNQDSVQLPLTILPGLLCDSRMFASQLGTFSDSLCVDGFYGGADRMGDMALYALERMPPRSAVLGHSMGARVALEIYRIAPDRVARLALADTGVHAPRAGEREKRYALRDTGRTEGFAALVDAWLPPMIGSSNRHDAALYAHLRSMCLGAGQAIFEAQIEALLHRPELESLLPTISCPVSLIVGEEDEWAPVAQHREIASAISGAELTVLPRCGHLAPAERPGSFNDALSRWLAPA
jgi:pimeloyl-ACP methyl ester carboxylesterase